MLAVNYFHRTYCQYNFTFYS